MAGFLYSSPASSCNSSFCSRSDSPASIRTCPRALRRPRHVPQHCPPSTDPAIEQFTAEPSRSGQVPLTATEAPAILPPASLAAAPARPRRRRPHPVTAARARPNARPPTSVAQFPAPKIDLHFASSFLDASRGGRCALSSSIRGPVTGFERRVLERIVKAHSSPVNLHPSLHPLSSVANPIRSLPRPRLHPKRRLFAQNGVATSRGSCFQGSPPAGCRAPALVASDSTLQTRAASASATRPLWAVSPTGSAGPPLRSPDKF
ncbi:hypothetical protein K505DRAFT_38675 [Melanomma pulvis-pyrius CBS 109.77]|uniref:Uncharacterized protein n=1 Tax=Melanomma pulvis-pyrius CBS 109.77 TaxID=1314802 RepID=A0A6A6XAE2_9PLEO|nr:hypothetical protein K505DRAFT_38675 [Melanomma pulvis-pyrius CBS 109.77]